MRALLILAILVAAAAPSMAVEPAYTGPFGNAEEPALRPYKWLWHGTKAFFHHIGDGFIRGNMNRPVVGSPEALRGLRKGTVDLGESMFKGINFAPKPDQDEFKELGDLNQILQDDMLLRNASDAAFSMQYFPAIKANDWAPWEDDEIVERRLEKAEEIRKERKEAEEAREAAREKEMESRVDRAQRHYVGDRVDQGRKNKDDGRGNLLRLGR
jgi:hypothetical protein